MRINFLQYTNLLDMLGAISNVVDDSLLDESKRNVIFQVNTDTKELKLLGVSKTMTYKRTVNTEEYVMTLEDKDIIEGTPIQYFQVKSKDLLTFLNTYKSLRKTKVQEVILELIERKRVVITVVEQNNETDETLTSVRHFVSMPIPPNMMGDVTVTAEGAEVKSLRCGDLQFFIQTLTPNLQSTGAGAYGNMMFTENYVTVMSVGYTSFMVNKLAEDGIFSGIALGYKAVSLIDKVICIGDIERVIGVARLERTLYFKTEDVEAFISYTTKLTDTSASVNNFIKERALSLDRIYLKDVLKRLSYENESIEVKVKGSDGIVVLGNKSFSQELSALRTKNLDDVNLSFKVTPEVLNHAILGNDDVFDTELFLYFNEGSSGVYLTDAYAGWFTLIAARFTKSL